MTIAKLRGIVDTLDSDYVILDVAGVGYGVSVSTHTSKQLQLEQPATLWVETVMKQEQPFLCGFSSDTERQLFRLLISVQGAGAKTALALLSSWSPGILAQLIQREDIKSLTEADGVGPKLASRLVLELKKKVLPFLNASASVPVAQHVHNTQQDALEGLVQLGYNRNQAFTALQSVLEDDSAHQHDTAHLIRLSLQRLAS